MPAPAYSTRFLLYQSAGNEVHAYTVPAGRRAVVRRWTLNNTAAQVNTVYLAIAGYYVMRRDLQATPYAWSEELRLTLYAGEQLLVQTALSGVRVSVDGFLFTDVASAQQLPAPPDEVDPDAPSEIPVDGAR